MEGINLDRCTVKKLKELCRSAGISSAGNKQELRVRLRQYYNSIDENSTRSEVNETVRHISVSSAVEGTSYTPPQANSTMLVGSNYTTTTTYQVSAPSISLHYMPMHYTLPMTTTSLGTREQCAQHLPTCAWSTQAPIASTTTTGVHTSLSPLATAFIPRYDMAYVPAPPIQMTTPLRVHSSPQIQLPIYSNTLVPPVTHTYDNRGNANHVMPSTNHTSSYDNLRDIVAVLPEFHPCVDGSLTSDQFISRVKRLKEAYNWNDKILLYAVQSKLKGPAKTWIDHSNVFQTWEQFENQFLLDFPTITNIADVHIEMIETKRKHSESLEEYYYKMLALGRRGNLPDTAIIKYVLHGINDNEFRQTVAVQNYSFCNELLCSIKRFMTFHTHKYAARGGAQKQKVNYVASSAYSTEHAPKINDKKQIKCYNCLNSGHISINCPLPQKKIRCAICMKTTHSTTDCPMKSSRITEKQANVLKIDKIPDKTSEVLKEIEINNKKLDAFIDLGSDQTLIRKTLARKLGETIRCEIKLSGFGGSSYLCQEQLKVQIKVDENTFEANVLVVDDELMKYPVLLGRDILCRDDQRFIVQGEDCWFEKKRDISVDDDLSREDFSKLEEKLSAIKNFKEPTNVTEVRRFLGLSGFFRKFVENYSLIAKPLTTLLKKSMENKFAWEQPQRDAFKELIRRLTDKPTLALYDFNAYHEVHTDASCIGLAGVLLQSTDGKDWRPVSYYSRHCTEAERKFHSYELEVLAAVESLARFRIYVLGKPIRLVTDCSAIAKIKDKTEVLPRIARWWYRLLEYNVEIVHRAGSKLAHVDALSRSPDRPAEEPEVAGFVFNVTTCSDDWISTMQLQDETLTKIIAVLRNEKKDDQEKQFRQEYQLINNRLYKREDNEVKFVVPKAVRWRITKYCHDDHGHFGLEKTIQRIKQQFWFPRIRNYVKKYIASCIECCYNKIKTGKREGCLYSSELQPIPFQQLHIDHLGPFVRSKKGNTHIVAISDAFSKYLVVKAVRSTKTSPVINILNELTSYFGLPKRIVTDRGTAYTSKTFTDYCDSNNIQHIKTAVRTPRANGQVERANNLILSFLRTSTEDKRTWDEELRQLQWTINSQKNATTKYSPNEIVFDFAMKDVIQNKLLAALQDDKEEGNNASSDINAKRADALRNITKERQRWKERFDAKHAKPTIYSVDDLVLVENEPVSTGESRKLEPRFRGPYIINKILGNDRYLLEEIDGMQARKRKATFVHSSDKLRPWCYASPELDGLDSDEDVPEDTGDEDVSTSGLAELSQPPTLCSSQRANNIAATDVISLREEVEREDSTGADG